MHLARLQFFTEVGQLFRGQDLKVLLEYGERPDEYGKLEKPGIRDGIQDSDHANVCAVSKVVLRAIRE
jgi:hypothetical protein